MRTRVYVGDVGDRLPGRAFPNRLMVAACAMAAIWTAVAPHPGWGQSAWPSYPNNTAISVTSSGDVGVGTTSPATSLDVAGTIRSTAQTIPTSGAGLEFLYSSNTGYITAFNRSSSAYNPLNLNGSVLTLNAYSGGNVGIGTASPAHLLEVAGTIGATEVITGEVVVESSGYDYVFEPGYRLAPLSEVGRYIKEHQHLPDIPSAKEVQQKGVGLGEMQGKLLAKVEELTLHMIQADERNSKLEAENRDLRARIERLESRAAAGAEPRR